MTQIFAFVNQTNEQEYALFAGADCEGTYNYNQTKDPNVQKLFVPGGKYFLMASGPLLFLQETANHVSQNIDRISSTDELADKILEFSDELSDRKTREKQGKPYLQSDMQQGLEFIACGRNNGKDLFDIYHIDTTGTGFMLSSNLQKHGFEPEKFEKGKEKKYIAVAGSGVRESATLINAFTNRSSEGPASIMHMPNTKYPLVDNMIFHTYLADIAATTQGVGKEIQYGWMTQDDNITVLFPGNMNFADTRRGIPTSESVIANAYLQNLFNAKVNSKNFFEFKEIADKLHNKYSTSLRQLKRYGEECIDISFTCTLDPTDYFKGKENIRKRFTNSALKQADLYKSKADFIQRFTTDLLEKSPRLLEY